MTIKPILFNTEMVRANLDGRKSCTRRIVKGFIPNDAVWGYTAFTPKGCISCRGTFADGYGEKFFKLPCEPGDILYVRETWERFECWNCEGDERGNCPKEPQKNVLDKTCGCYMYRATDEISGDAKWHPSIHMPKEAARIWLKVTDVRVERLQDITENGAKAEGAKQCYEQINTVEDKPVTYLAEDGRGYYVLGFKSVWNSTIKKSDLDRYGWDANPYVWLIKFERCENPEGIHSKEDMNISTRLYAVLHTHGVKNIEDMRRICADDLLKWNDLGRRTLEELLTVMKENDVKFKEFIMED